MAISPLDGRYAEQVDSLRPLLSEYGLMHFRLLIELRWLRYCVSNKSLGAPQLSSDELLALDGIHKNFDARGYQRIKTLEKHCSHDVKAVERYIVEQLESVIVVGNDKDQRRLEHLRAWTHFACTSEDINNLAWALMLKETRDTVLSAIYKSLSEVLEARVAQSSTVPMLARTHGQPASPTTMGKELAVFSWRLDRQRAILDAQSILGKFNGAVGNYNAHRVAYPQLNWPEMSKEFVSSLGLEWAPMSTQIEAHDWMAEYFDTLARLNTVLLDLCRDIWGYISLGYFAQKTTTSNQVGSSAMPHKINPIDFENAEGNIGIANSVLRHLSAKLTVSRWQRDLSDSTTMRNIGVAIAHSLLAVRSIEAGMHQLDLQPKRMREDLDQHWSVLAEAIQTVMRRHGISDAYDRLKEVTRGQTVDAEILRNFINDSELPDDSKQQLCAMEPSDYIGFAVSLSKPSHRKVPRA